MSHFHGTPGAVRQRCPGSRFGVGVLAALAILVGGCESGPCVSSIQCASGLICVHTSPGTEWEETFCAKPCDVEQDTCDTGEACYCPDSPAKTRCFDGYGNRIGICDRW